MPQESSDKAGMEAIQHHKFYEPLMEQYPLDYFGVSTRGDLIPAKEFMKEDHTLSQADLSKVYEDLVLDEGGMPSGWDIKARPERAIFCSHTLNMKSVRCIGYDMDYTRTCTIPRY
jgi:hypothetical protein